MRHVATLLLIAGCGFSAQEVSGPSDARPADGPTATSDATTGSDAQPCTAGFVDVCDQLVPAMALDISTARTLDTDRDPLCRKVTQGGRDLCLIYATDVEITQTGSLTVTGGRPLALVSATKMTIDGAIDVASHGPQVGPAADDLGCKFVTNPDMDQGGGGGGAGGTFTLPGGDGGKGDKDASTNVDNDGAGGTHGSAVSVATLVTLRGGCRGQRGGDERPGGGNGGNGGHAGGALYLGAHQSISVAGSIRATGAGGAGGQVQSGGGGGGSGGLVVIESPAITITGQISANGGGGGQGGGRIVPNPGDVSGLPGEDGALGTTAAAGGFGANANDNRFSTGGTGGAGTAAAGAGTDSILGGGGGGGAAGAIRLLSTSAPTLTGSTISPPPT